MNIALSSRHTVHATRDGGSTPKCLAFGHKGAESYRVTTREVTCKKCLKALAVEAEAEAAYQDRLAASMAPATESDDLGYVAPAGAEDEQPEEIREIREAAEAEAQSLRDGAAELRARVETRAGELFDELRATVTRVEADQAELTEAELRTGRWSVVNPPLTLQPSAPIVAELNGRAAVWMVIHQGRQMWQARDAQGLFTSKDRAVAAQRDAAARLRQPRW